MTAWKPRALKPDWRAYLTEEERSVVNAAERRAQDARRALAEASATINPIRMRACQRRLYADRFGAAPRERSP